MLAYAYKQNIYNSNTVMHESVIYYSNTKHMTDTDHSYSLIPRPLPERERAWYTSFVHALFPSKHWKFGVCVSAFLFSNLRFSVLLLLTIALLVGQR